MNCVGRAVLRNQRFMKKGKQARGLITIYFENSHTTVLDMWYCDPINQLYKN